MSTRSATGLQAMPRSRQQGLLQKLLLQAHEVRDPQLQVGVA